MTTHKYNEPMLKLGNYLCLLGLKSILWLLAASGILAAGDAPSPKIDRPKLEMYLRYVEGYTAQVKFVIDDPTPSAYKGFSRVLVHLSLGAQKVGDRLYYVTPDGERFLSGSLWDVNDNPFADNLEHLPANGPSFGSANAKVTIVAFSDFQCPYCREFANTIRTTLPKQYPETVRFVFKDFPLDSIHPWARAASEAAHCVGDLKPTAFWAFHDWIFQHQGDVDNVFKKQKPTFDRYLKDTTIAIAKEQAVDTAKVESCLNTHATATEVEESLRAGRELQVQQTPTSFINGRLVPGTVNSQNLAALIQLELDRPKEIPAPGTVKCCEVTIPTVLKK